MGVFQVSWIVTFLQAEMSSPSDSDRRLKTACLCKVER
jgi:hypothetical protein